MHFVRRLCVRVCVLNEARRDGRDRRTLAQVQVSRRSIHYFSLWYTCVQVKIGVEGPLPSLQKCAQDSSFLAAMISAQLSMRCS